MRVLKYLRGHIPAVALIVLLLVAQSFCELSLPAYTSRIVTPAPIAPIRHKITDKIIVRIASQKTTLVTNLSFTSVSSTISILS